jgi:hypothetical protein
MKGAAPEGAAPVRGLRSYLLRGKTWRNPAGTASRVRATLAAVRVRNDVVMVMEAESAGADGAPFAAGGVADPAELT